MAQQKSSGISVQTLAISASAAVAAAVIVPLIWEQGTLVATAMTPVIVALVSEGLRHPAERITTATSRVPRRPAEPFDPLPEDERGGPTRDDDPFGLRERPPMRRHWRLAVVTGLVAFVLGVTALTISELVFGGAATDKGRTTFFSGNEDGEATATPAPDTTPEATPEATPTPAETPVPTATPEATATPGAPEATPTPTVTP